MIESTLFQIGKKNIFPKIFKYLTNGFNSSLAEIFSMNQDIVWLCNNKNIEFLNQDFTIILLEGGQNIRETRRHKLVFKVAILNLKSYFPLVIFLDLYLIICVS